MWMPFEPDTLAKDSRFRPVNIFLSSSATRAQSRMSAPSPGSKSKTIDVGRLRLGTFASKTCFSMSPRFVTHTSVAKSLQRTYSIFEPPSLRATPNVSTHSGAWEGAFFS